MMIVLQFSYIFEVVVGGGEHSICLLFYLDWSSQDLILCCCIYDSGCTLVGKTEKELWNMCGMDPCIRFEISRRYLNKTVRQAVGYMFRVPKREGQRNTNGNH